MPNPRENPFIIGDWIKRDEDFIGRQELIARFTSMQRKLTWLIGARRMGKTSLLRAVQRRLQPDLDVVALFWDVSGADSTTDLQETLLDALAAVPSELDKMEITAQTFEQETNLLTLLRKLHRQCLLQNLRLCLLVDESEALLKVASQESGFSLQLTAFIQGAAQLYLIMASNHGFEVFDALDTHHIILPFLQPFMPPIYLPPWNASEASVAAARAPVKKIEQEQIVDESGGLPYLVQLLGYYCFETGDLKVALQQMEREQMLDLFFRDDFRHFDEGCRRLLARIACMGTADEEELEKGELVGRATRQRLELLRHLGFIRVNAIGGVLISNLFLRNWILQVYLPANPFPERITCKSRASLEDQLFIRHADGGLSLQHLRDGIVLQDKQLFLDGVLPLISDDQVLPDTDIPRLGSHLYDQLFPVRERYWRQLLNESPDCSLAFSGFDPRIPLEFLHDGHQFLALLHPLYRETMASARKATKLKSGTAPKILLIASDTPPALSRIDRELTLIGEQLRNAAAGRKQGFHVTQLLASSCSLESLRTVTAESNYDIVHYAGHCSVMGPGLETALYFRRQSHSGSAVSVCTLSAFLTLTGPLQLLYLNCCGSALAQGALHSDTTARSAKYILHQREEVKDEEAAHFAVTFYRLLILNEWQPLKTLQQARQVCFDSVQNRLFATYFALKPIIYHCG